MTEKISDAELIKLFNKNKLFDLFNMTVLEVDTTVGNIKVEFDIDKKYCNPAGDVQGGIVSGCLLYTSPSPRDFEASRMPSSA